MIKNWAVAFYKELKRQWIDEKAWQVLLGSIVIGFLIGFTLCVLGLV